MKIALVTDCYLPRLGGIEVQVRDLALRLAAAGHQVEVFTATVGQEGQRGGEIEELDGIAVHRLGLRVPGGFPLNPFAVSDLRRRLGDGTFDAAHVHMGIVSPFTVDTTNVARELGLPTTMTWHCMLGVYERPIGLLRAVRRWTEAGVAMNAVSGVAAAPIQRLVGDDQRVAVLPNGIDVHQWWQPGRDRPAPPLGPDGTVQLVSAMRLVWRKRPLPMLAMLQRVREMAPEVDFRLSVLGDGRLSRTVAAYVRREGLGDWVELPGRVSREELLQRYARAHLYLSPARLESFGIAALEARCAGLPVIGRSTSGAGEFVHNGVNGYLEPDDQSMARAVVQMLREPELRDRMHRYNATVAPSELDWSVVLETTMAEYERAAFLARGARPIRVWRPGGRRG